MTTTTHLTPAELDALLEAARAASRGPWKVYKTPFTLTELGRQQGFKEDRKSVVNAIGQAWDHPQLKGPMPIVTTQHGPYYEPQHAVKIEDEDAEFIATANPATIERLVLMVRELQQIESLYYEQVEANQMAQVSVADVVEHFRARAVRAIREQAQDWEKRSNFGKLSGYVNRSAAAFHLAKTIESLPLMETEGES